MGEPFEQAVSNGRRGRHAAPSEQPRMGYLGDVDYELPDGPADRVNGHRLSDERFGADHRDHNGNGAAYPGYGLPAEWAQPRDRSPASTQPSLSAPDWDEASHPAAAPDPYADLPGVDWQRPAAEPTRGAATDHGGRPSGYDSNDHAGPNRLPVPSRDRHAASESAERHRAGEPVAPAGPAGPAGPPAAAHAAWHGANELDPPSRHGRSSAPWADRVDSGGAPSVEPAGEHTDSSSAHADGTHRGQPPRQRLAALAAVVNELADGCRSLARDLHGAGGARHSDVADLLGRAADGADGVRHLLETAHQSLHDESPAGFRHQPGQDPAERIVVERSFDHLALPESVGHNGSGPNPLSTPAVPQPREAPMPPELPSTAPSYPPVLPLGLRDGAQAAVVARQVEAARRHLATACAVGHEVNDPAWRQQLLGMVEHVLAAVAEVATLAGEALAPSAADTTFPDEARFLCALPWEHGPATSPERPEMPASVNGVARLLLSLGYEARATRTEQGALQVEVRGTRYAVRVVLQQLRLSGAGEWMAYLDWTDGGGHPRSGAETLGPAELTDEELARRVDDALRRRIGPASR